VRGTHDEIDQLVSSLNAMLSRIQQLMDGLRQVSSDIAHDLRTPLGRLRQHLEDARARATTTADYDAATDAAIEEADELLETFSALLRIAQVEAGAQKRGFSDVDLSDLVRSVGEAYQPAAEDSQHTLDYQIEDGIRLIGDRQLLAQMISNLVENALRHTQAGSTVSLALRKAGPGFEIEVADNGPGIPETEYGKVFDRFYRLDHSRRPPAAAPGLVKAIAGVRPPIGLEDRKPGLGVACGLIRRGQHDDCRGRGLRHTRCMALRGKAQRPCRRYTARARWSGNGINVYRRPRQWRLTHVHLGGLENLSFSPQRAGTHLSSRRSYRGQRLHRRPRTGHIAPLNGNHRRLQSGASAFDATERSSRSATTARIPRRAAGCRRRQPASYRRSPRSREPWGRIASASTMCAPHPLDRRVVSSTCRARA
jgi:ElaB/YqjD/DUF883 family membrane-anchored ribosome-binding protein